MKSSPHFSIVAVNWNGRRYLERFVASLGSQTFTDFELIVVDNLSTDGSREWLESRSDDLTLIANGGNAGYARALNQGARLARGEWLITSNVDLIVDAQCLEKLRQATLAMGGTDMLAACTVRAGDPGRLDTAGHIVYADGLTRGRGVGQPRENYAEAAEVFGPSGAFAAFRRELWERLGGMDEDFFAYCEDADLAWRARLLGSRCMYVPGATVYHEFSASYGRASALKMYLVERNRLWLAFKNLPAPMLAVSPCWTLWRYAWAAAGLRRGCGFASEFRLGTTRESAAYILRRAYLDAGRALPCMLAKRREIQGSRVATNCDVRGWLRTFGVSAKDLMWRV